MSVDQTKRQPDQAKEENDFIGRKRNFQQMFNIKLLKQLAINFARGFLRVFARYLFGRSSIFGHLQDVDEQVNWRVQVVVGS